MAEYSSTTAAGEEQAAVISDSEVEDNDDGIVEILDVGSPHTLPPEVWAMVINCEFVFCLVAICLLYIFINIILKPMHPLDRPTIRFAHIMCINFTCYFI